MQRAHEFGSFNIRRILVAENPPLLADDEAKILNMVRQVLETKAQRLVRRDIEILKPEILEVGQKNVARKLVVLEARDPAAGDAKKLEKFIIAKSASRCARNGRRSIPRRISPRSL
jgi:hypothetical protein